MPISEHQVFWTALAFRLINCALVQTFFVPDEYFQSLEPAHKLVFGYGVLTWEWREGLRSYIYPLIFAVYYATLKVFGLDSRWLIVQGPRVMQSLASAVGDVYLFKLSKLLGGEKEACFSLFTYWASWFGFFCSPRTLTNNVETVLTLIGLYHYPWPDDFIYSVGLKRKRKRDMWAYLAIACFATIIRPTAVLFWAPLVLWNLYRVKARVAFIMRSCLPIGLPILVLSIYIDRLGYGKWILSAYNFAMFNVFKGGSAHFGTHPWYWYVTAGLPSVLTTHLPLVLAGIKISSRRRLCLAYLCLWYILFHSVLAHKEQRFLMPLVPLACTYIGQWLVSRETESSTAQVFDLASFYAKMQRGSKWILGVLLVTIVVSTSQLVI